MSVSNTVCLYVTLDPFVMSLLPETRLFSFTRTTITRQNLSRRPLKGHSRKRQDRSTYGPVVTNPDHHFRNEKGNWSRHASRSCFWDCYWERAGQLLASCIFLFLLTVPEVSAKVNSAQFTSRPLERWRHFTTTTRIRFVFPFIFKFGNPSEV